MPDQNESSAPFGQVVRLFSVPALIGAYFFQPDVAAISPLGRSELWLVVMVAIGGIILAFEFVPRPAWRGLACAAVLFAATQLWNAVFRDYQADAPTNDARCAAIQADMLSAHPRRADGPDLFQALGCRPQGVDSRVFAPPTDRELRAHKALPWGGYPRPE